MNSHQRHLWKAINFVEHYGVTTSIKELLTSPTEQEFFLVDMTTGKLLDVEIRTMALAREYNKASSEGRSSYRWLLFKDFFNVWWAKMHIYEEPIYPTNLGLYELTHQETFETSGTCWMLSAMAEQLNNVLENDSLPHRWVLVGTFEFLAGFGESSHGNTEENTQ